MEDDRDAAPRDRSDGSPPPARHIRRRRARPGFPEFGRHAGGHARSTGSTTATASWRGWSRRASCLPTRSKRCGRRPCLESSTTSRLRPEAFANGSEGSFGSARDGRSPPRICSELEPLNRLLERDEGFGRIVARDHGSAGGLELRMMRRWRSPESLLLPIGEALAKFVCEEDFSNVKACEGPACTLMFADHTRGHARRWCSMAICGNRAKQAAHRHRLKAHKH